MNVLIPAPSKIQTDGDTGMKLGHLGNDDLLVLLDALTQYVQKPKRDVDLELILHAETLRALVEASVAGVAL